MSLLETVLTNVDRTDLTTGLFFDLLKAFNFVAHDILVKKLKSIDHWSVIKGNALKWKIKSPYLTNRIPYVVVDKVVVNELVHYSSDLKIIIFFIE